MEKENKNVEKKTVLSPATSVTLGLCLGVAFCFAFNNIILGVCMGICLSLLFNQSNRDK